VPVYAYVLLAVGWILWFVPFAVNGWNTAPAERRDSRARWGLVLQVAAYALLFGSKFWELQPEFWRVALSLAFFAVSILLSATAVRALGRHLRFDAALDRDHLLVSFGPYRVLRHPIYTSMLCTLLATGFLLTPANLLLIATLVFLAGTEIRVRIEDRLLAARFTDEFQGYQRTVSAYIPFIR
jgi:protein-S-isoprenylcysteine O-methyltransferase Ste14